METAKEGAPEAMIIETERLILRPWEEADAEECFRYAKDPNVGPMAGWQPHTDVEYSRQVIREVLMVPETYAIVLKETGLPVGSIGLHHNDLAAKEDEAELGYWIGVPCWGRGLVPEAARALLRHAFEDLGLARIWCGYYDGNEKSKRVQEKLGFQYQWTTENVPVPQMGEMRKGHVNLMTKEEWGKLYGGSREFFMKSKRAGFSRWSLSDLPLAWQLWGDARVTRYICADGRFTKEEIEERLKREIRNDSQFGVQYWPVFDLEKGGLIGCCGLRPHGEAEYELGFHLFPGYWGKGYAVETAQAVIDFAFQTLHAKRLFAGHHPDNEASRRVLEKLGFSGIGSEFYAPTGRMHPSYELRNPGFLQKPVKEDKMERQVLFINACVRKQSRTMRLAEKLFEKLDGPVEEIRLNDISFPAVDEEFLNMRDLLISKEDFSDPLFDLAKQFARAETIVIAAPYWDLSFPAVLKQYFEQINVLGITFRYTKEGVPVGLCRAKQLFYVATAGGFYVPEEFGFGYVKALAQNFYGIQDVRLIQAVGLDIDGADVDAIMRAAEKTIAGMDPEEEQR